MNGSDSDSEQKKWGQKRQQLDAAVSTARFNGAIEGLIQGTTDVRSLIGILDELTNMQSQRGRYMTEILALKMESRRLLTAPFNERVAEFLIEGARRIPWLSDGLASQFAVALGSAADNPAYLETVNTAVGNLLLDVTRPLKPDTRNYLRALTDKIVASRRLQEARGHLAIVPSVYPSAIPQHLADAGPLETAPTIIAQPPERAVTLAQQPTAHVGTTLTIQEQGAVAPATLASPTDRVEPTPAVAEPKLERGAVYPAVPGRGQPDVNLMQAAADHPTSVSDAQPAQPALSSGKTTPGLGAAAAKAATSDRRSSARHRAAADVASRELAPAEPSGFTAVPAVKSVPQSAVENDDDWADLDQDELQADQVRHGRRGIPIWILVVAAGAVVAAGVAVWLLTRDVTEPNASPAASASAAASASSKRAKANGKQTSGATSAKAPAASAPVVTPPPPAATPPPPVATPPSPPPAVTPPPPPAAAVRAPVTPKTAAPPAPAVKPLPVPRTPSAPAASPRPSKPTAPVIVSKPAPAEPAKPSSDKPAPKPSAESPDESAPATPRTPTVSRTVDDIIVELLQVPNDVTSIEAKAHEVARIVARSQRNDAEIILRRMIPEEVLAGTESVDTRTLEPVRRVVALLLKKVALDKDDQRAALAIETLGEWAKLRKHGAAAKLTLDELAEERVVLSRPKRLSALERVQSRLGISNAGE